MHFVRKLHVVQEALWIALVSSWMLCRKSNSVKPFCHLRCFIFCWGKKNFMLLHTYFLLCHAWPALLHWLLLQKIKLLRYFDRKSWRGLFSLCCGCSTWKMDVSEVRQICGSAKVKQRWLEKSTCWKIN